HRSSDKSVIFERDASSASRDVTSNRVCLGAYATTTSPGSKARRAKTPRPSIALCRKSTGDKLNIAFFARGFGTREGYVMPARRASRLGGQRRSGNRADATRRAP